MENGYLSIKEAMAQGSGQVKLRGWIYRERKSKKIAFLVLRDSTDIIQCVVKKESVPENVWEAAEKLSIESSLTLEGEIKPDERSPSGYEVTVTNLDIVQFAEKYPITKDQSTEFLLDQRHLWIRSRKMVAIFKVRDTILKSIQDFYRERGYIEFSPPIFTPNACEGGSTLFEVKYYNDIVYLTQTWQLYAEAAVFALEKIFCISPCFRSEKSKTSRHLSEFWMHEMEIAWGGLKEVADVAEDLIEYIAQQVLEKNKKELKILERDISKLEVIKKPFVRMTYTEALEILKKEGTEIPWGKDLRTVEEEILSKMHDKPIIITNYPKEIMAFYKPKDPNDEKTALCMDIIAPESYGEIIGGSERDTDLEELKKALEAEGEDIENYDWYLDLRKFGSAQHAGFGMGVERVLAWICGLENIKDAIPFPRTMLRKTP